MKNDDEKWAIFWCDLLREIIFDEIPAEAINQHLKQIAAKEVVYPDGRVGKPSLSTLKRKLKRYRQGGLTALYRKQRSDIDKPRTLSPEIIEKAVELKKTSRIGLVKPLTVFSMIYTALPCPAPPCTGI